MTPPTADEDRHIAAIRHSAAVGFEFLHLYDSDGSTVVAIHAQRRRNGAVDTYTIQDMTEAVAARYQVADYPNGDPIWQEHGTVEYVIGALLQLPPHGSSEAPAMAQHMSSSLWLPGNV